MKAAIAALLIIAVIIAATVWNALSTQAFLNDFIAAESISVKRTLWEDNRLRLRLTVNRKLISNVETALNQLEAYADRPLAPEAIAAADALRLALENIHVLESFFGVP